MSLTASAKVMDGRTVVIDAATDIRRRPARRPKARVIEDYGHLSRPGIGEIVCPWMLI